MGSEAPAGEHTLRATVPAPADLRLLRDGEPIATADAATELAHDVREPGVYRVEARRRAHGRRAPGSSPIRSTCDDQSRLLGARPGPGRAQLRLRSGTSIRLYMRSRAAPDSLNDPRSAARFLGFAYAAGATLAIASMALPQPPGTDVTGLFAIDAVALLVGVFLLLRGSRVTDPEISAAL